MTDLPAFERRIAALVSEYAARPSADVDPIAVARTAAQSTSRRVGWGWLARSLGVRRDVMLGVAVLAVLGTTLAGLLVGSLQTRPVDSRATPAPHPTSMLVYSPASPETSQPLTKVGFVGLPRLDATPSLPETGELILRYDTRTIWPVPHLRPFGSFGQHPILVVRLYADGRLIWALREGSLAIGANDYTTGLLEQRLTPDGAEMVLTEALATGLFERDQELRALNAVGWASMQVRNGERLVGIGIGLDVGPNITQVQATPIQLEQLERLHSILTEPQAWLPARAWQDPAIREFVPARYAVCVIGATVGAVSSEEVVAALPEAAQEILARATLVDADMSGSPYGETCPGVTTKDAQDLAAVLALAGSERNVDGIQWPGFEGTFVTEADVGLSYKVRTESGVGILGFDPILPDGSTVFKSG